MQTKKLSDHFDGHRYFNPGVKTRSIWEILKWRVNRKVEPWPLIPIQQAKITKERTAIGECLVTYITHSTVLIQNDGKNILTDPIWSKRASPLSFLGPQRITLPGIKFEDLPPIDIVLISHNHYDHMDIPTLKKISKEHNPVYFVPKGNRKFLKNRGITGEIHEMDWWDHQHLFNFSLHFVPAQHFTSRHIFDFNRTLWGGFVLKGIDRMIYFAGDSGYCDHFKEIQKRLGSPDLSILPIGAFEPRWFMASVHLSPEEAVQVHLDLQSKQSLAIHFGTFQLADEKVADPVDQLKNALKKHHLPANTFWILKPGESREVN